MLCCAKPTFTSSNEALMGEDFGIHDLLASIDQLRSKAEGRDQDLEFLSSLLQSQEFRSLIMVHEMINTPERIDSVPGGDSLTSAINEVISTVLSHCSILEIEELLTLMSTPHFKAFARAYDQVATKDFQPSLPDIPFEVDEDDDVAVKIVRLVKGPSEPLGATIHRNDETGVISVARVMHGGAADRCGLIHSGDIVKEVNGIRVTGKSPEDVVKLLTNGTGSLTMTLVPGDGDADHYKETQMRVKVHFAYDPKDDRSIPCNELGLSFSKGDILEIVCQDDPLWWQARKDSSRPGLIPSRLQLERKEAAKTKTDAEGKSSRNFLKFSPKPSSKLNCAHRTAKKQSPDKHAEKNSERPQTFYEEVERYLARPRKFRPIVLVGVSGVGKTELERRLVSSAGDHFCGTTLYSSLPKKQNESCASDYHFLSRKEIESEIQSKRFVEYGEHKGNLFGARIDQIKSIISNGNVCVMSVWPQAMKTLRCSELKPFIVFVKPPSSIEQLLETRNVARKPSISSNQTPPLRSFTEEELTEVISSSLKVESLYGSYFDSVIVNDDLDRAAEELCRVAESAEREPFWVPVSWLH